LTYEVSNGNLPATLAVVTTGSILDPWGNPTQYVDIVSGGSPRLDAFLAPLNTTFDLYSMGKDGLSQIPLTAGESWDDIVRGNDGTYLGLASAY
jgi:general secretion pathway protein G